ncbi:MAG TPA: pyridoxamine 5'-phosphate oxidase family protein [Cytophagaceae bacterium]
MIGILDERQIDMMLREESIGRIGCHADDKTYVVPVTYVFHKDYIYGHTAEGQKVNIMRRNPNVCFEVDRLQDMANWQSVIIHGEFEELEGEEAVKGVNILTDKLMPKLVSESAVPVHGFNKDHPFDPKQIQGIVYRIKINQKTGRFEKK